jgi:hypothetical protein
MNHASRPLTERVPILNQADHGVPIDVAGHDERQVRGCECC